MDFKKSALIVGATGLIGRNCAQLLCESGLYEDITSLARRPSGLEHDRFNEHIIDFDRLEDFSELFHCRDVFCCLGTIIKKAKSRQAFRKVDYEYPMTVAELARKKGAERFFVVSSIGARSNSKIFYIRTKGELERDLGSLGFSALHIFRPSLLLGKRAEFRFGEYISGLITPFFAWVMKGPLKHYRPVKAECVARAMVEAARSEERGTIIHKSGDMH